MNCIHCQAIADGKRLFKLLEGAAKKHNIHPERMLRGIEHALGIWAAITFPYMAEERGQTTTDEDFENLIIDVALKIREAACIGETMVTDAFRDQATRLLADSSASHGRHDPHGKA